MTIVKLAPDEKLVMLVRQVAVVPGQYGESVRFIGESATDKEAAFNMSPDNADRQFKRLGLTAETVIGRTVEFSAKKDGARKLIDMKLPAGSPPAVAASPSAAPVMSAPAVVPIDPAEAKAAKRAEWDALVRCYRKCLREAKAISADEMQGVGSTDVGLATVAGSLFQAVLQRNLCA